MQASERVNKPGKQQPDENQLIEELRRESFERETFGDYVGAEKQLSLMLKRREKIGVKVILEKTSTHLAVIQRVMQQKCVKSGMFNGNNSQTQKQDVNPCKKMKECFAI